MANKAIAGIFITAVAKNATAVVIDVTNVAEVRKSQSEWMESCEQSCVNIFECPSPYTISGRTATATCSVVEFGGSPRRFIFHLSVNIRHRQRLGTDSDGSFQGARRPKIYVSFHLPAATNMSSAPKANTTKMMDPLMNGKLSQSWPK